MVNTVGSARSRILYFASVLKGIKDVEETLQNVFALQSKDVNALKKSYNSRGIADNKGAFYGSLVTNILQMGWDSTSCKPHHWAYYHRRISDSWKVMGRQ